MSTGFQETSTLRGTTVVVIGGSSGMGMGVARSAAAQGADVVIASRDAARLEVTRDRITGELAAAGVTAPGSVTAQPCDLADEDSVRGLFDRVGRLDHLVITASPGSAGGAFLDTPAAQARGLADGKLWGSWTAAREAALRMKRDTSAGSILFGTGGLAVKPAPGRAAVTVAFAAVEALARALAVELAPLRVNAIRPGLTDSDMWSSVPQAQREQIFGEFARTAPVRRVGSPEDFGTAATYLMTATFVTGVVLDVDGGAAYV
ncbi:SDR family oxidoreductase [Streptomyces pseudovenezuelae]|uniref:NAD(P)-dependent dehydrogenase (Short-subunit alcohol dehydrogenase family) n=1 Tax=Streptomyces pseudovenezuelae TaxID=67350 RepID=A0ABT6LKQ2_9ACTN|nr:SDR family oxidoreductase [Streptomyces pseudovenezuelae]MDH6216891.1 NAD(P)-dependent dehydrogenase (short-subunit alcohol dehydrogenase family) [Streptomyces pseudovenezuelae]